jgi:dihydroorotate dehydrogenase (fumarate)
MPNHTRPENWRFADAAETFLRSHTRARFADLPRGSAHWHMILPAEWSRVGQLTDQGGRSPWEIMRAVALFRHAVRVLAEASSFSAGRLSMALDTTTSFLGMELATPLVVGACPLTLKPETARQMVGAGAAALVLPSVFEEQIEHDQFAGGACTPVSPSDFPVSLTFTEAMNLYNGGLTRYLGSIEHLRNAASVPIIANMNGVGAGQWLSFARQLEDAGADAIELTLFRMAMDPSEFADDIEQDYLEGISSLCDDVQIPILIKLQPYFTSLPNFACRIAGAGAMGLTLFGRYPRFGGKLGVVNHRLQWGLTDPGNISLALQWLPVIRPALPKLSLAASGGVSTAEDMIQLMRSGADVVMVTSEIYRNGVDSLQQIFQGACTWARQNGREQLRQIIGEACHRRQAFAEAHQRAAATYSVTASNRAKLR